MEILKRRETPLQNLAYIGIMAAINIVFVLFCEFVPFLLFLFIFILSLASSIVAIYCEAKYIPIYMIVTALLCCFINLGDTLFYIIPTLISGSIFGFCVKKKLSPISIIFITILVQILATYPCLGIYKAIYEIDLIPNMIALIGLADAPHQDYLTVLFMMIIAASQTVITYITNSYQFEKLHIEIKKDKNDSKMILIILLLLSLFVLIFRFIYGPIAILALLFSVSISLYQTVQIFISKNKNISIFLSIIFVLIFVLTLIFKSFIEPPLGWLILEFYPLIIGGYLLIEEIKNEIRLYK